MNQAAMEYGFAALDIPCLIDVLLPAALSPGVKHLPDCIRDSTSPTERNLSLADSQSHLGAPRVGTAAPQSFIQWRVKEGGAHYLLGGLS